MVELMSYHYVKIDRIKSSGYLSKNSYSRLSIDKLTNESNLQSLRLRMLNVKVTLD